MRLLRLMPCVLFALPLLAQQGPPPIEVRTALPRYEARIHEMARSISLDAYIVSQLVLSARDLDDFQKTVAVEKVYGRMKETLARAKEENAAPSVIDALTGLVDTFAHAEEQGAMASIPTLREDLIKHADWLQRVLFSELDHAREERKDLLEVQTKVNAIAADLEGAMIQALATTFDFIREERK